MIHHISFKHAFDGIKYVFTTQPNMRFHTLAAFLIVLLSTYFKISRSEWILIVLTIVMVVVVEMLNTSIESMTDLITLKYHKQAKIAKDVSAGMVLISAIGSVVIGLVIFLPYLLN